MFPGGKGATQAVAAARLGGDVTFVAGKVEMTLSGNKHLVSKPKISTQNTFSDESAASGV
jgi:ribokinase